MQGSHNVELEHCHSIARLPALRCLDLFFMSNFQVSQQNEAAAGPWLKDAAGQSPQFHLLKKLPNQSRCANLHAPITILGCCTFIILSYRSVG